MNDHAPADTGDPTCVTPPGAAATASPARDSGSGKRPVSAGAPAITRIVVSIHGMGNQLRSDTSQAVAARFARSYDVDAPVMPLGHFSIPHGSATRWSVLRTRNPRLRQTGFAEVYWADIPRQLVGKADTLEETRKWGRTVVGRARAAYRDQVPDGELSDADFAQGMDALDTIIEGIGVLESIVVRAGKVLPLRHSIAEILRDHLGDVQTVTEFPQYRNLILYRFHATLNEIVAAFAGQSGSKPEIYLVAHSEGTVVTLLALLQALLSTRLADPDGTGPAQHGGWVEHVRGLMTIGAPIDKHIALWPELWDFNFVTEIDCGRVAIAPQADRKRVMQLARQIKWKNYYDYGDPVGFRLDETRRLLERSGCRAFEFHSVNDDHGYSRSWLPGKAHVDYWRDDAVFTHFIDAVMEPAERTDMVPPPASRRLHESVAKFIPYLFAFALHYVALMMLSWALAPGAWPAAARFHEALAPACGLFVLTFAVRMPQLVRHDRRWMAALVACGIVAGLASWWMEARLVQDLSQRIGDWLPAAWRDPAYLRWLPLGLGALLSLLAWFAPQCRFGASRTWLVAAALAGCIVLAVSGPSAPIAGGYLMQVLTAFGMFIGMWWLGIILFDLAFVWHRYIRCSVTVRTLREWQRHRDAQSDPYWGLGKPARKKTVSP